MCEVCTEAVHYVALLTLGPRTLNVGTGISNLGSRISNLGSRISNLESWISDLESRISDLESRISNLIVKCVLKKMYFPMNFLFWRFLPILRFGREEV